MPFGRPIEPGVWFRRMTRIGNRVIVPLLRSPLAARIHDLALLSFVGRRTGATYTVPDGIHAFDGAHVVLTASGWRANLRGGAAVQVVKEGRPRPMHAELIEDVDEVARIYGALLTRGPEEGDAHRAPRERAIACRRMTSSWRRSADTAPSSASRHARRLRRRAVRVSACGPSRLPRSATCATTPPWPAGRSA